MSWACLDWRRLRGDLIHAHKYLQGVAEDGARLFSGVLSDRTRSNGHEVKHKEFQLNTKKNFLTLRWQNSGTAAHGGQGISLSGHSSPTGTLSSVTAPGVPALVPILGQCSRFSCTI